MHVRTNVHRRPQLPSASNPLPLHKNSRLPIALILQSDNLSSEVARNATGSPETGGDQGLSSCNWASPEILAELRVELSKPFAVGCDHAFPSLKVNDRHTHAIGCKSVNSFATPIPVMSDCGWLRLLGCPKRYMSDQFLQVPFHCQIWMVDILLSKPFLMLGGHANASKDSVALDFRDPSKFP
ncbi:hypothetical protein MJO29_000552 [Puccinia striiformis f. sp. tritici]|uniref:hypothetical protein n=1 Tax=Puccinia striiformis f. sp. tritici TaxID=168172 RepID=UPI0020079FD8|nr:hypothetical protein Pst134EA_000550 [Puccinia striiformis f. sp. tritici]KAH9466689.1 hypothetical protein Pst134EB_001741 [Puccinia striiformis f. sp. tritici]KAH9473476.1 hypothetical protein Pst134EA_000550 [Puccinia striiformis f. sp. tritici]KAI7967275.1 hypothetical protein MJO29_000552 [Puccinia striiformis f. sp. tritici]KAI9602049.1 hypothetical protein KEM48_000996 [Puccinia striiformis f. sp. tritici PST-130]